MKTESKIPVTSIRVVWSEAGLDDGGPTFATFAAFDAWAQSVHETGRNYCCKSQIEITWADDEGYRFRFDFREEDAAAGLASYLKDQAGIYSGRVVPAHYYNREGELAAYLKALGNDPVFYCRLLDGYMLGDVTPAQALESLAARGEVVAEALEESQGAGSVELSKASDNVRRVADMIAHGDVWAARSFLVVMCRDLAVRAQLARKWKDHLSDERRRPALALYREAVKIVRALPREESAETYVPIFRGPEDQSEGAIAAWYGPKFRGSVEVWRRPGKLTTRVYMEAQIDLRGQGTIALLRRGVRGEDREAVALHIAKRWAALLESLIRCEDRRAAVQMKCAA